MNTKNKVLFLLEKNRGNYISGADIARELGISRNAVSKVVKELCQGGYKIDAVTNKGYCLVQDNDILSPEGIYAHLHKKDLADTLFVHNVIESTNTTAKEMAIAGAKHGTIILANQQTAGRGRHGRQFFSPESTGIYVSFILHPQHINLASPTLITTFAAVAVCQAIEVVTNKAPQIKWINDIFLGNKKISGILTEAVTNFESGAIDWIVLGIGINFSTSEQGFPTELTDIAGSIFAKGESAVTRNELVGELINKIMDMGKYTNEDLLAEYKKRLMMLGEEITVHQGERVYDAVAVDIDNEARLVVKKDDGEVAVLNSGEISIRRK